MFHAIISGTKTLFVYLKRVLIKGALINSPSFGPLFSSVKIHFIGFKPLVKIHRVH